MNENKSNVPKLRFPEFTDVWEQRKLGELVEISSASRVHKDEWAESGVPFFRSSDVVSAFKGTENEKAFISFDLYEELAKKSGKVQAGDVLITGGGSIGIPYKVLNNEPLYFKDADLLWLRQSGKLDGDFLYIFFTAPVFRAYVQSISHIGTIAHYTIEQVRDTPIALPEIAEQKCIGAFFKSFDHLITLHQHKLGHLQEQKSGLLQKMFPKDGADVPEIRFPEFTDAWEQRKLGELAVEVTRKAEEGSTAPVMMISAASGFIDQSEKYSSDNAGSSLKNYTLLQQGELAYNHGYSKLRNFGSCFDLKVKKARIPFVYHAFALPKDDSGFFAYYLNSGMFDGELKKRVSSTARMDGLLNISYSEYMSLDIFRPAVEEQTKIAELFASLDHLITLHQRKLGHLQEQKKALLQQMFI
jgi:type I restriction enzyme S subunit